jgi:hypothetical protein
MSTEGSEQQPSSGCLLFMGGTFIIGWGIVIASVLLHPPIDYIKLSIITAFLVISLVFLHPPVVLFLSRFPFIIRLFPVLIFGFSFFYPLVTHSPVDYFSLFMGLNVTILLALTIFWSHRPWFARFYGRLRPFTLLFCAILAGTDILRTPVDSPGLFWKVILYAGVLYFLSSFRLIKEEDREGVTG